MKKKLFICGGHVTPALALIDELKDEFEIVFLGRTHAVEHTLVLEKGIRFLPIVKIPIGFIQACAYCLRQKPNGIVSFGGYVALPVAVAGWILRIPVITHEQTRVPGRANRIIANIARRVCVTFDETKKQFPSAVVTGLPMRKELFVQSALPAYPVDETYPLLYITGGSQGARSMNEKIAPAIAALTGQFTIIHQTGPVRPAPRNRYITESYIPLEKLPWVLHHAHIVIGRSGANTTMELAALGKVAILVPLPWSAGGEQRAHAKWLEAAGTAVVIEQKDLTEKTLLSSIQNIMDHFDTYKKSAEALAKKIPRDGAKRLAAEVRASV